MRGRIRRKTKMPAVQTDLKIGQPGDKYEQEADAVADRVASTSPAEPAVQMQPSEEEEKPVQMQPDEEETVSMKPEEEQVAMSPEDEEQVSMKEDEEVAMKEDDEKVAMKEDEEVSMKEDEEQVSMQEDEEQVSMKEDEEEVSMKEEEIKKKPAIQKSGDGSSYASPALANQISQTKGQGNALGDGTKQELGQKMGADFSGVKIHTDQKAAEMNEALGAKAFTHGHDIYFNRGNYDPGSSKGKHLLAHELTHVVQQSPAIQKSETLENVVQRQENNQQQPTTTNKALTSYNGQGWLLVKLDGGDIVSLAKNTRVAYLGYNNDKSRENFKILDWPYANKKASVAAISASQSRFGNMNYSGGGKVVFEIANKRMKYGSSSWIAAYTLAGNEVPVGTHKLWLPDYPHSGGNGYTGDSALATIWFRIGGESSSRYLHIGRYTAGCVTVGAVESGDESARQQWTNICNYLLSCRSGNDSVGEIEVKT